MSTISHQTIRLARGKHSSPREGACVMELASMLAGEPFSDHPASVCPVIGSFLRAYNDAVDDERRQDLYAYASEAVGSRSGPTVSHRRAELLFTWAQERYRLRRTRLLSLPRLGALSLPRRPSPLALGAYAVQTIRRHSNRTHADALALVDALFEIGRDCGDPSHASIERPAARLTSTA